MAEKDNAEYWRDRALRLEARSAAKGDALEKKLKREYEKAAKAIREKIDAFYGRYASENGLSYAEAVKRLDSREAREWKKTLGEYVDEINAIEDQKLRARLTAELDARSYASQQDRLSALQAQIDMEVDRLFSTSGQQMTATMTEVLTDGYDRKAFDLQRRAGVLSEFARLSPSLVEEVLAYPWSGASFSARLWENKRALLFALRQEMTQGIIQGLSVATMSKNLADTLGKSYTAAERLIRTETNHVHNEAVKAAYKAAGVEAYEFVATLDSRTCPVCGALDGKHFSVSEAIPGTNYPPLHPNDRCATVEYDPEDAADWAASGLEMPENMTYDRWKELQDSGAFWAQHFEEIPVTPAAIERVARVAVPELGLEASNALWAEHRELLRLVQMHPAGTEVGRAFTVDMRPLETVIGEQGRVRLPIQSGSYIAIHNHPDGGTFSLGDLYQFVNRDQLKVLTAVGNDGDVYVLAKATEFHKAAMAKALGAVRRQIEPLVEDGNLLEAANEIEKLLKGVHQYGARYYAGNAKNV